MLYFKTWIIWNKSLLIIHWIFNFFHLLIYEWKLNKIMDSCMANYNYLGYLTISYSIGIPSFNQQVHQKMLIWPSKIFCTKICIQIPFIQKYMTNIEKPNPIHGLCVLSSSIIEEILAKTSTSESYHPLFH
jgi:hypothetical protein